jgi:hypothetical protein
MGTEPCTGRAGAREAEAAARGGTSPRLDVSALALAGTTELCERG